MDWAHKIASYLYEKNLLRFFPWRFLKAYVYPLTIRQVKKPYQAARYFESYYKSFSSNELSDRITVGPAVIPLHSKYHYNAVENSLIRYFVLNQLKQNPSVLDIGSGAGHWLDFYLNTFHASFVCGLEIAKTCAESLQKKYAGIDNVSIVYGDISSESFALDRKFDVINAIGVIFHIVDDASWQQALTNMRNHLTDGGIIVVGGEFGLITQNVQFHSKDNFESIEDLNDTPAGEEIYFNKRIRSLRLWKKVTSKIGLNVQKVIRTPTYPEVFTPENNVMVLAQKHK